MSATGRIGDGKPGGCRTFEHRRRGFVEKCVFFPGRIFHGTGGTGICGNFGMVEPGGQNAQRPEWQLLANVLKRWTSNAVKLGIGGGTQGWRRSRHRTESRTPRRPEKQQNHGFHGCHGYKAHAAQTGELLSVKSVVPCISLPSSSGCGSTHYWAPGGGLLFPSSK